MKLKNPYLINMRRIVNQINANLDGAQRVLNDGNMDNENIEIYLDHIVHRLDRLKIEQELMRNFYIPRIVPS